MGEKNRAKTTKETCFWQVFPASVSSKPLRNKFYFLAKIFWQHFSYGRMTTTKKTCSCPFQTFRLNFPRCSINFRDNKILMRSVLVYFQTSKQKRKQTLFLLLLLLLLQLKTHCQKRFDTPQWPAKLKKV
jgi:hypothetical protein